MFDSNNFSDWLMCNNMHLSHLKNIYIQYIQPDEADGRPGSPLLPLHQLTARAEHCPCWWKCEVCACEVLCAIKDLQEIAVH